MDATKGLLTSLALNCHCPYCCDVDVLHSAEPEGLRDGAIIPDLVPPEVPPHSKPPVVVRASLTAVEAAVQEHRKSQQHAPFGGNLFDIDSCSEAQQIEEHALSNFDTDSDSEEVAAVNSLSLSSSHGQWMAPVTAHHASLHSPVFLVSEPSSPVSASDSSSPHSPIDSSSSASSHRVEFSYSVHLNRLKEIRRQRLEVEAIHNVLTLPSDSVSLSQESKPTTSTNIIISALNLLNLSVVDVDKLDEAERKLKKPSTIDKDQLDRARVTADFAVSQSTVDAEWDRARKMRELEISKSRLPVRYKHNTERKKLNKTLALEIAQNVALYQQEFFQPKDTNERLGKSVTAVEGLCNILTGFATSTTTAQPSTSRPATDSQTAPADVLSSLEAAVEALSHAMIGGMNLWPKLSVQPGMQPQMTAKLQGDAPLDVTDMLHWLASEAEPEVVHALSGGALPKMVYSVRTGIQPQVATEPQGNSSPLVVPVAESVDVQVLSVDTKESGVRKRPADKCRIMVAGSSKVMKKRYGEEELLMQDLAGSELEDGKKDSVRVNRISSSLDELLRLMTGSSEQISKSPLVLSDGSAIDTAATIDIAVSRLEAVITLLHDCINKRLALVQYTAPSSQPTEIPSVESGVVSTYATKMPTGSDPVCLQSTDVLDVPLLHRSEFVLSASVKWLALEKGTAPPTEIPSVESGEDSTSAIEMPTATTTGSSPECPRSTAVPDVSLIPMPHRPETLLPDTSACHTYILLIVCPNNIKLGNRYLFGYTAAYISRSPENSNEAERSFRRLFPFQRYPGISLCKLIRFGKKGIAKFSVKTLPFDSNVTITPMDIHREITRLSVDEQDVLPPCQQFRISTSHTAIHCKFYLYVEITGLTKIEKFQFLVECTRDISSDETTLEKICWMCGSQASISCSYCSKAHYCGTLCQQRDLANHKYQCLSYERDTGLTEMDSYPEEPLNRLS